MRACGLRLLLLAGKIAEMQKVSLKEVAQYCDRLLASDDFDDWPGSCNGLQVESRGGVSHVAAAVDAMRQGGGENRLNC